MSSTNDAAPEIWRAIPDYEGLYEVSDLGRVRSLTRMTTGPRPRRVNGRVLKLWVNGHGYLQVDLHRNGSRTFEVHRLVLLAFAGPCPTGMQGCHNNAVRTDARLVNLRWDTPSANNYDTVRHGHHATASRTHCAQGHPFSPENTIHKKAENARVCRTCYNAYLRGWRANRRQNASAAA